MLRNEINYYELSRGKVSDSRNIIFSTCSKGGFTIAQQLEAIENGKMTSVFLKGAFHVEDIKGLYNVRDAVNLAIKLYEEDKKKDEEQWDK